VPDRSQPQLLVSVHDVTPAHEARLAALYRLLDEAGVRHFALLVVPNWHGAWPLEEFPSFTAELHERAAGGTTVFLHGLRHDEVGQPRSLAHRARTFGRTNREGEFASLPPEEAQARIARGLATLRQAGLDPIGFVPPAWLARPGLDRIALDAGLALTEDARAVFVRGRRVAAPATCWSTRSAWRRTGSAVVAAARLRFERSQPLVRLALHPHDADWSRVLDSCRRTLMRLLDQRAPIDYRELMGRTR
jgi:predicted deacetylase